MPPKPKPKTTTKAAKKAAAKAARAAKRTTPPADDIDPANDPYRAWTDSLVEASEDEENFVRHYARQAERALVRFWEDRGGKFTAKRRDDLAKRLARYSADVQLMACEILVDKFFGIRDERFLIGIARRLALASEAEFDADVRRHRTAMHGQGLFAEACAIPPTAQEA